MQNGEALSMLSFARFVFLTLRLSWLILRWRVLRLRESSKAKYPRIWNTRPELETRNGQPTTHHTDGRCSSSFVNRDAFGFRLYRATPTEVEDRFILWRFSDWSKSRASTSLWTTPTILSNTDGSYASVKLSELSHLSQLSWLTSIYLTTHDYVVIGTMCRWYFWRVRW